MEERESTPSLGGWYKFQIWFALFLSAAMDGWEGFEILSGRVYELAHTEAAEALALHGAWLGALNTLAGLLTSGLALFSLVTQVLLAKKRRLGIEFLHINHWANLILCLSYRVFMSLIFRVAFVNALTVFEILFTAVMIAVNKPYFEKREALFH